MRKLLLSIISVLLVMSCTGCATTDRTKNYEEPRTILAIEIGSKGVKGKLFNARITRQGTYDILEMSDQRDVNTNTSEGFDEVKNPLIKPEKMAETAEAVVNMIRDMKREFGVSESNIHLFGSSAIIKARNSDQLFSEIAEKTNIQVQFIDVRDEVFFGYINSVPTEDQSKALLLDIGSGNTKLGYYDPATKNSRSVDIPFGTKSYLDNVVQRKGAFLLNPVDIMDEGRLIALIDDHWKRNSKADQSDPALKVRDMVLDLVMEHLSSETHAAIMNFSKDGDKTVPPQLIENLIFDLNRIILENDRLAAKFYTELFPGGSDSNASKMNRLILEKVFPLRKMESSVRISAQGYDVLSRVFIRERLKEKMKFCPELKERKPTYMTGGIIWALVTLTQPEAIEKGIVSFTYSDVVKFTQNLSAEPEGMFSPKRLLGEKISSDAFRDIQKIKQSVYSLDELQAGISILKSVLEELNLTNDTIFFVRNSGWYKGAILSKLDSKFFVNTKSVGTSSQNSMTGDTDEGVFSKDGRIYVKVKERSLLSVIDEVAYKLRVNYTVLADLSQYSITVFDNCENNSDNKKFVRANWSKIKTRSFASIEELLLLLNTMKDGNGKSISIQFESIGDGIVLKNSKEPVFPGSYKKVFLNGITTKEAEEALKRLYFARENGFTVANQSLPDLKISSSGQSMPPPPPMPVAPTSYMSFDSAKIVNDTIVGIPTQNALIIKAKLEVLTLLGDIIASLDVKYPQVLIETKVFEVDDSISKKIGVALDYSKKNGESTANGVKTLLQEGLGISGSTLPALFFNFTDAEKKLSLLSNLVLNDRDGLVKILAEPRIVMKPGEEAAIALTSVQYVSIQGVQTSDLKGVETGITFKITPIILNENRISLRLAIEQSEFIPTSDSKITLATNKNTIYTTVVADDGEMISIGGIDTRRSSKFSSGLPFLKDIPFLGALFSSRTKDSSSTKIEFMIRPVIKQLNMHQKQTIDVIEEKRKMDHNSATYRDLLVQ